MSIFKNNIEKTNIRLGNKQIQKVYKGTKQIWIFDESYILTIDSSKVDSTLTGFPVMVKATSADYDMSLLTDDNVYFTDTSDNLLDFEIAYATSNERIYHVKIPTISSSTNTQFKLKFDGSGYSNGRNPENVWSDNYRVVLHMGNPLFDSSPFNTSFSSNDVTLVTGKVGQARSFNTSSSRIDLNNIQGGRNVFTWSGIFKNSNSANFGPGYQAQHIVGQTQASGDSNDFSFIINSGTIQVYSEINGATVNTGVFVADNNYHHAAVAVSSSGFDIYVDGVLSGSYNGGMQGLNTRGTEVGASPWTANRRFGGILDEIRISNATRNSAYIKAEYHSLFNTLISNVSQVSGSTSSVSPPNTNNVLYDYEISGGWSTSFTSVTTSGTAISSNPETLVMVENDDAFKFKEFNMTGKNRLVVDWDYSSTSGQDDFVGLNVRLASESGTWNQGSKVKRYYDSSNGRRFDEIDVSDLSGNYELQVGIITTTGSAQFQLYYVYWD